METIGIEIVRDSATGLKMFEIGWPHVEKYEQILDENRNQLSDEQIQNEEKLIKKFKSDLRRAGSHNFVQYWLTGKLKG